MKRFLKYDTEITKKENSPVDKNGLIKENIVGGGSSVQPDWNQNDSTQPDYVKNRPFYMGDPVETALVEEQTVAFSNMEGVYAVQGWPTDFDAVEGQTYKISWDGTVYECVCSYYNGAPLIGNMKFLGFGIDTGEPFIFTNQGAWVVGTNDTASEHIIKISGIAEQIIKIDEKYLPMSTDDSYGVVKKADIVSAYNFPDRAEHDKMVDAITAFETGNASIVWGRHKVNYANYDSSNDTISVVFACEPMKLLTFSNSDGFYVRTLGSPTYGELQGKQVRIVNDEGAYIVLSTEGTPSDTTLTVLAERISIGGSYYGVSKTEMILKSSTANSTKKFKITVDDSGTITATEVT